MCSTRPIGTAAAIGKLIWFVYNLTILVIIIITVIIIIVVVIIIIIIII